MAYTSTDGGGSSREYSYPARERGPHAEKVRGDINAAVQAGVQQVAAVREGVELKDIALEFFSEINFDLTTERLDDRTASIELLSTREEGGRKYATVFVPEGKIENFIRKIDRYEHENDQRRKDGGPKNKDLVESIAGVRLPVVRSFWTDDPSRYPQSVDEAVWWEVWLRTGTDDADEVFARFVVEADSSGLRINRHVVSFPERLVFLVYGAEGQWANCLALFGMVAELRRAKEIPTDFVDLEPYEQGEFVAEAAARVQAPAITAPAVCLLDTGLNSGHPLLAPLADERDLHAVHPAWDTADHEGHGTQMAGVAAFGDGLAEFLAGDYMHAAQYRIESVKLIHPTVAHDPDNYGYVTTEAVAIAERANPRRRRVACLAITSDDRDVGFPTSWSAAIDQHTSGHDDDYRRLYVVAAGNIRELSRQQHQYPTTNYERYGIEDPAQSYNALTVGAYTNLTALRSDQYQGAVPVAPAGSLSPLSRTSRMWSAREWPFKPDIVMEGGNYITRAEDADLEACDDLRLLTTAFHPSGRLLDTMSDTSAAAAQAAKLSAELMSAYPHLWPETIRGLMVHSAQWTEQMLRDIPGQTREAVHQRLRSYGYGVPNGERAAWSVDNSVSLLVQESLQPFRKVGSDIKTHQCHFHSLPWPQEVLESLGELPITIRVTLSYFVEPSPGRRGWTSKFRYASHGLRFAMRGPTESDDAFTKRISKAAWSEEERKPSAERTVDRPATSESQPWVIGSTVRVRGSVHSDWWTGTAADAAASGVIAVYPITGWWKERGHLNRYDRQARYAMIVTIESEDASVDLYTPIAQQLGITIETTA